MHVAERAFQLGIRTDEFPIPEQTGGVDRLNCDMLLPRYGDNS
jgi:hypothetical protein